MAHCTSGDDATAVSIREYLERHYGLTRDTATKLMEANQEEVKTGIRLISNAGYVGDKLAQTKALTELVCPICEGDEDND